MAREELKHKFAELRARRWRGEEGGRRSDYKGRRVRFNLRIPVELMQDIAVLRLVGGEDANSFCVRVLQEAVSDELLRVRQRYSEGEWDVLVRCAQGDGEGMGRPGDPGGDR